MKRTKTLICVASLAASLATVSPARATVIPDPRLLAAHHQSGASVPVATAIGDVTGDGLPDLIVANGSGGTVQTDDKVFVFAQSVNGTLPDTPTSSVTPSQASDGYELGVGHLGGDGHADLAVGIPGVGIDLFFGTGAGIPATPDATVSAAFIHFAVGDMNDDGLDDLLYTKAAGPFAVAVRTQLGIGGSAPEVVLAGGIQETGFSLGDVDGDGRTDFVLDGPANSAAAVFLQDPTLHTFGESGVSLPVAVTRSFLADVNDDGRSDLVIAELSTPRKLGWALSNGDGTFGPFSSVDGPGVWAKEVGDLNGDGRDDLAAFTNGKLRVYVQQAGGGLAVPCVFPATDVTGRDAATSVGDLTGDGGADRAAAEGGCVVGAATVFTQLVGSDKLPTGLSLAPSASSIPYGDQVTLSGTLSNPDGGCLSPGSVTIHRMDPGGGTSVVGATPLADDLTFSTDVTPPAAGTFTYWATWVGDESHDAATSPDREVAVAPTATSLSLTTNASTVVFGHAVTLRSTLAGSSGSPTVNFFRFTDGTKTKIGSAVVDANGVAKLTITPSRNASYQARFAGDGGLLPSVSAKHTVNVRVVVVGAMVKYAALKGGVAIYGCCKAFYRFLVKPKHAGGIVRVAVQYMAGGTWHKLPSKIDTFKLGADGTDQIFLNVAGGKGYTFRVRSHFASDGDHLGAWSKYVKFRFR